MSYAYPSDASARAAITEAGRRLYSRGLVAANDGNISARVSENTIITTPSGVSKGFMTEDMLVKTDLDGNVLEGSLRPSSEIRLHLRIYKEDPEALAVVHAHPPAASAFAAAGIPLDEALLQEAVVQFGTVPLAKYALPGTEAVAESVAPYCRGYYGILLEKHGAVSWGKNVEEALFRMESIEHYATVSMYVKMMGLKCSMDEKQIDELIGLRSKWNIDRGGRPEGK